MNENAESILARLPEIKVSWDALSQMASVQFNPEDFKTWEFVQAILLMAVENCKAKAAMSRAAQMQQLMIQQQQDQALAQRLKRGH